MFHPPRISLYVYFRPSPRGNPAKGNPGQAQTVRLFLHRKVKETLKESSAAEQRIFRPQASVRKTGNTQSIPSFPVPCLEPKSLAVGSCRSLQSFLRKNWKNLFTFADNSCILCREQSRRPCVKCHRDGEFARRTKERFPRWGHRTRCCIWDILLDCSNDTRSGGGFG